MKTREVNLERFIYYILERELIRLRKIKGLTPLTDDPILRKYKFTNVRRKHDRTTQALIEKFYSHRKDDPLTIFLYNCALFRYFGTIEFAVEIGWQKKHDERAILNAVSDLRDAGVPVFTGAYVITNAGRSEPKEVVVCEYLEGLHKNAGKVVDEMLDTNTWRAGYYALRQLPGFGGSGFMAKEVLQDFLLAHEELVEDAMTWSPVGPGARRGLNRLHERPINWQQPEERFVEEVQEITLMVGAVWRHTYPSAGPLSAHDVQFCLCEYDKYMRVFNKEGTPKALYKPRTVTL